MRIPTLPGNAHRMSVTMGSCGDMSPKEYPLRISLMRISSGQQMPLTAYRGRIWGTALQKNSLKHSLTLFAQPKRLRKPQFWLNLTLQPKLWLRWNSFFYRWVSNLNLQFTIRFQRRLLLVFFSCPSISPAYVFWGEFEPGSFLTGFQSTNALKRRTSCSGPATSDPFRSGSEAFHRTGNNPAHWHCLDNCRSAPATECQ